MKVGAAEFETELFRERIEPFICRGAKGLHVVVRLCERSYSLRKKTRGNGRLQAHIELPDSIVERYQERDLQGRSWLSFALEFRSFRIVCRGAIFASASRRSVSRFRYRRYDQSDERREPIRHACQHIFATVFMQLMEWLAATKSWQIKTSCFIMCRQVLAASQATGSLLTDFHFPKARFIYARIVCVIRCCVG